MAFCGYLKYIFGNKKKSNRFAIGFFMIHSNHFTSLKNRGKGPLVVSEKIANFEGSRLASVQLTRN